MLKFLVALCLAVGAYGTHHEHHDCPEFGDWLPWTDQCLWFPLKSMRQGVADACQTTINMSRAGVPFPLPEGFQIPERCGHCSFKMRCRKREKKDGCFSLDPQKETCHEFGDVCTLPPHPKIGCKWNLVMAALQNCANRPDIEDWRRDALRKFSDNLPEGNCVEVGGQCKCCCHPYRPSDDGMSCVKEDEAQCEPFGNYNDWSQCLWYPMADVVRDIRQHCELDIKGDLPKNLLPTPPGFQIPEKCGYCSFRARCRKRERKDGCHPVEGEKKACGPDDCPTCADVCEIPKIGDTCDWGASMGKALMTKVEAMTAPLPYWRRRGIKKLLRHIPYGKCKEMEGKCKCCCHPYEPNEDGTACVLTPMCSFVPSH